MTPPPDFLNQVITTFVYPVLGALALAIVAYLTNLSRKWVAQQNATASSGNVDDAIMHGLAFAQVEFMGADVTRPDIQLKIVDRAYRYASEHVGDDLKKVGVDLTTPGGQKLLTDKVTARFAPTILNAVAYKNDRTA